MAASSLVCSFCRPTTRSVSRDTSARSGSTAAARAASAACAASALACGGAARTRLGNELVLAAQSQSLTQPAPSAPGQTGLPPRPPPPPAPPLAAAGAPPAVQGGRGFSGGPAARQCVTLLGACLEPPCLRPRCFTCRLLCMASSSMLSWAQRASLSASCAVQQAGSGGFGHTQRTQQTCALGGAGTAVNVRAHGTTRPCCSEPVPAPAGPTPPPTLSRVSSRPCASSSRCSSTDCAARRLASSLALCAAEAARCRSVCSSSSSWGGMHRAESER